MVVTLQTAKELLKRPANHKRDHLVTLQYGEHIHYELHCCLKLLIYCLLIVR